MQSKFEEPQNKATFLEVEESISGASSEPLQGTTKPQQSAPLNSKCSQNNSQQAPKDTETNQQNGSTEICKNFDDMGLREGLLRGIYAYGYEKPSAIQQRAIIPCCRGRDVIAQAQSGTGKTATFAIALIQQLDLSRRRPYCQVSHQSGLMRMRDMSFLRAPQCIGTSIPIAGTCSCSNEGASSSDPHCDTGLW